MKEQSKALRAAMKIVKDSGNGYVTAAYWRIAQLVEATKDNDFGAGKTHRSWLAEHGVSDLIKTRAKSVAYLFASEDDASQTPLETALRQSKEKRLAERGQTASGKQPNIVRKLKALGRQLDDILSAIAPNELKEYGGLIATLATKLAVLKEQVNAAPQLRQAA